MNRSGRLTAAVAVALVACGGRSTRDSDQAGKSAAGGDFGGTPQSGSGGSAGVFRAGQGGTAGSAVVAGGGNGGSSSGAAGAAGAAGRRPCGPLIDDMEDGTGRICPGAGRNGVWYAYNDGYGVQEPAPNAPGVPILPLTIPDGRNGSTRGMYSTFTYPQMFPGTPEFWGAGIGVDLAFDGTTYRSYDASAYDGITFFARSSAWISCLVRISTITSTLVDYGGTCPTEFCNPHGYRVSIGPDWVQHSVPFSMLSATVSYGYMPGPFEKSELTNIQFLFVERPGGTSDLWLDDLSFYAGEMPSGY